VKARHLLWLRRVSQGFFLILFLCLLVESRLPQDVAIDYSGAMSSREELRLNRPVTFFFKLDPLVGVTSLLAGAKLIKGFMWGAGVLVLTIFLGRIFCGFVCPLGTINHLVGRVRPALKGSRMIRANQKGASQRVKYFVLVLILVGALMGLNLAGITDPVSLLFRSIGLAILPGLGVGIRSLFDLLAESDVKVLNLLSYGSEVLLAPIFGYEPKAYHMAWFMGLMFLGIVFLNRIRPRFWCRVLCPLGALLGVFSSFGLLKLVKYEDKCTQCMKCDKRCQGAASPHPGEAWESSECLACFNCVGVCPESALDFKFLLSPRVNRAPDVGRRALLGGLLAGVSLPFLGRLDGQIHRVSDARLIRPPGAVPEKEFLELCQRCGLCMKVCPTNAINPTLAEAGMAGLWTPRLIMIMGYCEYTCTLCTSVCPTGAIKEITAKEKIERPIKIGSAFIDRGRCLPWSGNFPCIVCEEHCPTSPKAIYLKQDKVYGPGREMKEFQLPYVDLQRCVGCGICENKCPVRGLPAIRVISAGESRSLKNRIIL